MQGERESDALFLVCDRLDRIMNEQHYDKREKGSQHLASQQLLKSVQSTYALLSSG